VGVASSTHGTHPNQTSPGASPLRRGFSFQRRLRSVPPLSPYPQHPQPFRKLVVERNAPCPSVKNAKPTAAPEVRPGAAFFGYLLWSLPVFGTDVKGSPQILAERLSGAPAIDSKPGRLSAVVASASVGAPLASQPSCRS
jgi:hypothetical protein